MLSKQSLSHFKSLLRRDSDSPELNAILDLFPKPILVIDFDYGYIRYGNSKATALTGYTKNELAGLHLKQLFPDYQGFELGMTEAAEGEADTFASAILTRRGSLIPVGVHREKISPETGWSLISIEPVASQKQRQAEVAFQALRWDSLRALILSTRVQNIQSSFDLALEAGHQLSGAGILALYRLSGHQPNFVRYAMHGNPDILPQSLEGVERVHLLKPNLWIPGKPTTTSLNRTAKSQDFKYLATYPLIESNILQGLLVLGDLEFDPPVQLMKISQLISDVISGSIETKFLINNLHDRLSLKEKEIAAANNICSSIDVAILVTGKNLLIQEMNPAAEEKLGYSRDEVINLPIGKVLIGPPEVVEALQNAREAEAVPEIGLVRLHRRDGRQFPAIVRIQPLVQGTKVDGALVLIYDQSESEGLRRMNERLEPRAYLGDRLKEYSHDAKNHLAAIQSGTDVLLIRLDADPKSRSIVERIAEAYSKLEKRLLSILETSPPVESKMAQVNISEVISDILSDMGYQLTRANIDAQLISDPETPTIHGDRLKLDRVFENLVSNAIQAMAATGGRLTIKVSPVRGEGDQPDQVRVAVSDSGPGIPEDVLPRIFDQYFTTSGKRTGLGLSIVDRIIEEHNGTIVADSMEGGTIFTILLPVRPKAGHLDT